MYAEHRMESVHEILRANKAINKYHVSGPYTSARTEEKAFLSIERRNEAKRAILAAL